MPALGTFDKMPKCTRLEAGESHFDLIPSCVFLVSNPEVLE